MHEKQQPKIKRTIMLCHIIIELCVHKAYDGKPSADGQHVNCEKKQLPKPPTMEWTKEKKTTSHCIIYIHMGDVIRIEFRPKTNCRKSYKTWSMAHSHIRTSHHFGRMNQNRKKERTKKQKKKWCEKKAKTNKKNVRAITLLHNVLVICLLIFPFLRAIADRYIRC